MWAVLKSQLRSSAYLIYQSLLDNKINILQGQLANLPKAYQTKQHEGERQIKGFNMRGIAINLSCLPFLVEAVLSCFTLLWDFGFHPHSVSRLFSSKACFVCLTYYCKMALAASSQTRSTKELLPLCLPNQRCSSLNLLNQFLFC